MDLDKKRDQLDCIVALVMRALRDRTYETNSKQMALSHMLTCRIVEICSMINLLLGHRHHNGVPILLRTALEALVDFNNLIEDPTYRKVLVAAFAGTEAKYYKNASVENPYSKKLCEGVSFLEDKDRAKSLYEQHKSMNSTASVVEKFKRADVEDWYYTAYNLLCRDTHSNLDMLTLRHANFDGETLHVQLFKSADDKEVNYWIDTTASLSVTTANIFFDKAGLDDPRLSEAHSVLKEMRAEV